jgi:hypothetical protein
MVVWEYDWELSLWMSGSLVSWDQQWHRWYPDRNQARYGYDSVRFHHPESPYWGAIVNGTRTKQIFGMVFVCYICFITMAPLSTGKKTTAVDGIQMEHQKFTWPVYMTSAPGTHPDIYIFKLIVLNLIMTTSVSTCEQVSSSFMVIRVHIICMLNIIPRCNFKCAQAMHFHMSLSEKYAPFSDIPISHLWLCTTI